LFTYFLTCIIARFQLCYLQTNKNIIEDIIQRRNHMIINDYIFRILKVNPSFELSLINPNSSSKTKFHNFAFSMSLYRISFNLIIKLTLAYSSSYGPAFPKRKFWSLFETLFKMVSQITNHLRGLEWFHDVSQKLRKQRRKNRNVLLFYFVHLYLILYYVCLLF
jgi:hypothetical protein